MASGHFVTAAPRAASARPTVTPGEASPLLAGAEVSGAPLPALCLRLYEASFATATQPSARFVPLRVGGELPGVLVQR